jgi:GNAT superfamily N-acetyltransferase
VTISFLAAAPEDFEALLALRQLAMRESLERLGRFDEQRSRERFRASFVPSCTRHVLVADGRVGFVAVRPTSEGLRLDHLYVLPAAQGHGVGGQVLAGVIADADARRLALFVTALRDSDANRFYQRHGFTLVNEDEWDRHYRRLPSP